MNTPVLTNAIGPDLLAALGLQHRKDVGAIRINAESGKVVVVEVKLYADAETVRGIVAVAHRYHLSPIGDPADNIAHALEHIAYGLEQDGRTADGMTKAAAAQIARNALARAGL